jgi:hypothetical protein
MATPLQRPCSCGCNPCVCVPPDTPVSGVCIPDVCVPRPCFFDGQLMTADDMNAVVNYFRTQDAILSRMLGGWGILGGLKADAVPGSSRRALGSGNLAALTPNPQIIAGSQVQVSPGVAIDSAGRKLSLCESVTLDIQALARTTAEGTIKSVSCQSLAGPSCNETEQLTVSEFFLFIERAETPTRPAPRFSGGGACDPAPTCDFSRKTEEVRFGLVPCPPTSYQFTGCLDEANFALPISSLVTQTNADACRNEVFAFIDNLQNQLVTLCCSRPVVIVAHVALTQQPQSLQGDLPTVPLYTILNDGYPCRRLIFQVGLFTKFFPNLVCPSS